MTAEQAVSWLIETTIEAASTLELIADDVRVPYEVRSRLRGLAEGLRGPVDVMLHESGSDGHEPWGT